MKNLKSLGLLIVLLCVSLSLAVMTAPAQKSKGGGNLITSSDLDHAYVTGSQVFYQLRDEDLQGMPFELRGLAIRKVPAVITFHYYGSHRDAQGRLVFALFVERPAFLGGPFSLDEVAADPSREPGTFDTVQPGDLVD
jgi:hypothetical protein